MYKAVKTIIQNISFFKLKRYCREAFKEICRSRNISRKVLLQTIVVPFYTVNGFTISFGLKHKSVDMVVINLWPFIHSTNMSSTMTLFYLHAVVAHELEHVKILQDWYSGTLTNAGILFSGWAVKHIYEGSFPERIVRSYLAFKGASTLQKKRYGVSPVELHCFQFGFHDAFKRFAQVFDKKELETAQTIVSSIDFIVRHIEIDYFSSKQAFNRFTHTLYYLQRALQRFPNKVIKYPQMLLLFTPEGILKPPIQLYAERGEENAELIDQILIRMFITLSYDWNDVFIHNKCLYNHLCSLANEYCADAINYMKRMELAEVFLHKNVLQDNAAMLIKNVKTLNELMDQYRMVHTSGSLFPLYYSDDFTIGNP